MLISFNRIKDSARCRRLFRNVILTSTLSGCCLITKGLWCPMWMSGSSYVTECPTGITLGSSGPLVGVLHGKKFWTFLLCLKGMKKRIQEVNLIFIVNMTFASNRIFYNPSCSLISLGIRYIFFLLFLLMEKWIICNMCAVPSFVISARFFFSCLKCDIVRVTKRVSRAAQASFRWIRNSMT